MQEPTKEELTEAIISDFMARVMPVLMDADEYAEYLDKIAHVKFNNLAVAYMFELGEMDDKTVTGYIKPEMLEMIGETKESFFDKKIKKAMIQRPAQIKKLSQRAAEAIKEAGYRQDTIDSLPEVPESKEMLVIENGYLFGAITLFYPGVMEAVADLIGGSYYVIPSSRHEMLAAPAEEYNPEQIRTMLREINRTEVEEQDKLTDEIYFYDAEKNKFVWLLEDLGTLKN